VRYTILFIVRLLLVWLLFFAAQRLLFVVHYFSDFKGSFLELLVLPYHAFRMDLSSFAFAMGIPFVFTAFFKLFGARWRGVFIKITHGIIWFITIIFSIIYSSELVLYYEWRTKLSSKIFIHLETPSEVFRTSSATYTSWFVIYLVLQLIIFYLLYKWLILNLSVDFSKPKIGKRFLAFFSYLIIGSFVFILALRGGMQPIPISATSAYYSKKQIVNDLSVNAIWNAIHMTFQHFKKDLEGMYNRLDETEAQELAQRLYDYETADTIKILKQDRPNIVFVLLESWSGEIVGALGNPDSITPNFDQLCEEGLLFTNVYATSGTSETGNTSIFSGYPTVPGISISSESAKARHLPSIFKILKPLGYESAYFFGGALTYGNIGGYLTEMGVDRIVDEENLDLEPTGNLGVHDEAMFPFFLSEIKKAQEPFIYCLFTQSTHSPYDIPRQSVPSHPKNKEGFVNSLVYADNQLKLFTEAFRKLPKFEHSIVVFVADHGKTNYVNSNIYSDSFYHIPLLIWGGALKDTFKGKRIDKIGSQADIVKTVLNQMGLPTDSFNWSKNILDPNSPEWALLTSTMSFGIKDTTGYAAFHTINEQTVFTTYQNNDSAAKSIRQSRGLVESIYREFRSF
jgi:phosphoglycerol transferase MdoB-like AlkP superfamily enzyme